MRKIPAVITGAAVAMILTAGPASATQDQPGHHRPGPGHTYVLKDQDGHRARVTLLHVYDPGTLRDGGGNKDYPPAGKKWVVAAFRIREGKGRISEDIYSDFSVIGKNHQTYDAYITGDSTYNGYTDFNNGLINLRRKGAFLVGAAPVLMPARVGVGNVVWSMSGGFAQSGIWRG